MVIGFLTPYIYHRRRFIYKGFRTLNKFFENNLLTTLTKSRVLRQNEPASETNF